MRLASSESEVAARPQRQVPEAGEGRVRVTEPAVRPPSSERSPEPSEEESVDDSEPSWWEEGDFDFDED